MFYDTSISWKDFLHLDLSMFPLIERDDVYFIVYRLLTARRFLASPSSIQSKISNFFSDIASTSSIADDLISYSSIVRLQTLHLRLMMKFPRPSEPDTSRWSFDVKIPPGKCSLVVKWKREVSDRSVLRQPMWDVEIFEMSSIKPLGVNKFTHNRLITRVIPTLRRKHSRACLLDR